LSKISSRLFVKPQALAALLGYEAVPLGKRILTFLRNFSFSSTEIDLTLCVDFGALKMKATHFVEASRPIFPGHRNSGVTA
jgi:hypothetical protein